MSALPQALVTPAGSQQLLASVWRRNAPLVRQRISLLSAAAQDAQAGILTSTSQREAADIAHKLAGSLGMFGYLRGTEIARELEVMLEADSPLPTAFLELTRQLEAAVPV